MRLASPRLRSSDSGAPGPPHLASPDILAAETKTWQRPWNRADAGAAAGHLPSRRARVKFAAESRLRRRDLCCMFNLGGPVSTVYANSRRFVQNGFSEKFEGYSWNIPFNIWRA